MFYCCYFPTIYLANKGTHRGGRENKCNKLGTYKKMLPNQVVVVGGTISTISIVIEIKSIDMSEM